MIECNRNSDREIAEKKRLFNFYVEQRLEILIFFHMHVKNAITVVFENRCKKINKDKLMKLVEMRLQYDEQVSKHIDSSKPVKMLWVWESDLDDQESAVETFREFEEEISPRYIG